LAGLDTEDARCDQNASFDFQVISISIKCSA
jgi:hypothetical protein